MVERTVLYEVRDGVGYVTMNRPQVINAFDEEMHRELLAALDDADEDERVRCIVLKGSGRGFSSGADLASVAAEDIASFDYGEYLDKTYNRLLLRMMDVAKPMVASIHGAAAGAGLSVALACDFRIAAASASLSLAFSTLR